MADFNITIEKILSHEVLHYNQPNQISYVNDPNDPGGETNWGISKKSYPNLDIRNLTKQQAIDIYKRDYWDAMNGDAIKYQDFANVVVDTAVNEGVGTAKALELMDGASIPEEFVVDAIHHLKKLPGWPRYAASWVSRLVDYA